MKRLLPICLLLAASVAVQASGYSAAANGRAENLISFEECPDMVCLDTIELTEQQIPPIQEPTAEELQERERKDNALTLLRMEASADSIDYYRQQARANIAEGYAKLGVCYHYGIGVKQSFTSMLSMYSQYNRCTTAQFNVYWFIDNLSDNDIQKITFYAVDNADRSYAEDANKWIAKLRLIDSESADVIERLKMIRANDGNVLQDSIIKQYALKGNEFAILMQFMYREQKDFTLNDLPDMLVYAQYTPIIYNAIAGIFADESSENYNPATAVKYYQLAENALNLTPEGCQRMAYFCKNELGGLKYDQQAYNRYCLLGSEDAEYHEDNND